MSDYQIYTPIMQAVQTTTDVDLLIQKLEKLRQEIFQLNHQSFPEMLKSLFNRELAQAIEQTVITQHIDTTHSEQLKAFLDGLIACLQAVSVIGLTLSVSPTEQMLSRLSEKAKELFGVQTVLEISVQKAIVGGAIIVTKGKYFDYSMATKIKKVFSDKKAEILTILHS